MYNMKLGLCDFAYDFEGDQGMRSGLILVFLMWKRYAVRSQGLGGLSHHEIHLPKFILNLDNFLPNKLSKTNQTFPSHSNWGTWWTLGFKGCLPWEAKILAEVFLHQLCTYWCKKNLCSAYVSEHVKMDRVRELRLMGSWTSPPSSDHW